MKWIFLIFIILMAAPAYAQLETEPPPDLFPDGVPDINEFAVIVAESQGDESKVAEIEQAVMELQSQEAFDLIAVIFTFVGNIAAIGSASPRFLLFGYGGITLVVFLILNMIPIAQKTPNIVLVLFSFIIGAMIILFLLSTLGSGVIFFFENIGGG